MKIFIIDTYYQPVLDAFSDKNPGVLSQPYKQQLKALLNMQFGTADFYSKNLKKLGIEAQEFVVNDESLQKQWAKEYKTKYSYDFIKHIPCLRIFLKPNWSEKILEAQIKHFSPDLIIAQDLANPGTPFLKKFKPKVKLIVGQVASPTIFEKEFLSAYDIILTSLPHFVDKFQKIGITSEYFRIGFEETVLKKINKSKKQFGVVFVGGFSRHHLQNTSFIETFEYLAQKEKVDFWGYGVKNLSPDSPIRKAYHGEAWGTDMYSVLYNSKIALNRHIDVAENYANNMRLYEATGVGTMLITDYKDNLHELFEIGKEVETYKTKEELADKVKYYLKHEKAREKIAKAGQRRTLKDHTYQKRMRELATILNKYFKTNHV